MTCEASRHFRNKKEGKSQKQQTVRTKISESCIQKYINLRRDTNREIT
jgi:hypothetical protein